MSVLRSYGTVDKMSKKRVRIQLEKNSVGYVVSVFTNGRKTWSKKHASRAVAVRDYDKRKNIIKRVARVA